MSEIKGSILPVPRKDSPARAAARKIGRRWLAWRFRHFDPDQETERVVKVDGVTLRVLPDVFNPALHFTSAFFARFLRTSGVVAPGSKVLDIGTGSGILAISAARAGAGSVMAVDINGAAVESATENATANALESIVSIVKGDMFEPVAGKRFDLVVCNPPYLKGEPKSIASYAYWGGAELEWLTRFGTQLHDHLSKDGICIISVGDAGDIGRIVTILAECGWKIEEAARRDILFEIIYLFKLTERPEWSSVENRA